MELTHVLEYRFYRSRSGAIWTDTSYEYHFWLRYLKIFDSVAIVSRVGDGEPVAGWRRVDGPGVRVVPVPHYIGPLQYAARAARIHTAVQGAMNAHSAVLLRIPSQLGASAAAALWRQGRPYGVQVVGDPREAFSDSVSEHPLRSGFRWWFTRLQARQCARAAAALYVTPRLRMSYPPAPGAAVLDCSDVNLDEPSYAASPRLHEERKHFKLVTVATLTQSYKGIDVLLKALALCRAAGISVELTIVGSGRCEGELRAQAVKLGVGGCLRFTGSLPAGVAVRHELDAADLFVLPSRTEGMPRALLEAMARGLPCVATMVGGVPDVLPSSHLAAPGDEVALAGLILEACRSPRVMDRMSAENWKRAKDFCADTLYPKWDRFFVDLLDRTRSYYRTAAASAMCEAA